MTVSAAALDDLFTDPNLGTVAQYTPPAGAMLAIRAILTRPGPSSDLLQTGALVAAAVAEVRSSELVEPEEGATLLVGGVAYSVRSIEAAASGLVWRLALAEQ